MRNAARIDHVCPRLDGADLVAGLVGELPGQNVRALVFTRVRVRNDQDPGSGVTLHHQQPAAQLRSIDLVPHIQSWHRRAFGGVVHEEVELAAAGYRHAALSVR